MNTTIKSITIFLSIALSTAACSSAPEPKKRDPYNDANSQRSRAGQAQDEMSRDTSR